MNNSIFNGLSNFINRFRGNDRFTKTNPLGYFSNLYTGVEEVYVTINNNEFKWYQTTSPLQKVVNKDAQLLANGIFRVKTIKDDKEVDTPYTRALIAKLEKPNPMQTRNDWMMEYQIFLNIYGNDFMYFPGGDTLTGIPKAIWNLPPSRTTITQTGKLYGQVNIEDIIQQYNLRNIDGTIETIKTKDVVHLQVINPDNPLLGLSPLHGLTMEISNIRAALGFRNVILTKKGALGVMSGGGTVGPSGNGVPFKEDDRLELSKQLTDDYGQFHDQQTIQVTKNPVSWTPMTFPTKDLMLFEEIDADTKAIIDLYGHNESIYSTDNSAKFDNMNSGLKMVYQDRTIPQAKKLTHALSDKFKLAEKGLYLMLDFSHIPCMKEDEKDKAAIKKVKSDAVRSLVASGYDYKVASKIVGLEE